MIIDIFLYETSLTHRGFPIRLAAKFLWQRIPAATRESNPDLARLWSVGRALLEREPAETFKALPVDGWKSCKKEEIDQLRGKERALAENTKM